MVTIIRDTNLTRVTKGVTPDAKRRVLLPKTLVQEDVIYYIWHNSVGQIILDPQVTIPASELWLFKNKKALAMVDRGMIEEEAINRGSFAKYVKDAP